MIKTVVSILGCVAVFLLSILYMYGVFVSAPLGELTYIDALFYLTAVISATAAFIAGYTLTNSDKDRNNSEND